MKRDFTLVLIRRYCDFVLYVNFMSNSNPIAPPRFVWPAQMCFVSLKKWRKRLNILLQIKCFYKSSSYSGGEVSPSCNLAGKCPPVAFYAKLANQNQIQFFELRQSKRQEYHFLPESQFSQKLPSYQWCAGRGARGTCPP